MPIVVKTFPLSTLDTNVIALIDEAAGSLWLFDAPMGVGEILRGYTKMSLEGLFLTHGHYDHILGVSELVPLQTFGGQGDKPFFETPQIMKPWMDPTEAAALRPVKITSYLKGGEVLEVAGLRVEVRASPGHSLGGLIFYIPDLSIAIVGDTIFRCGVGRTDLPGGSSNELAQSIRNQVFTLPDATKLFPGHGPATTVIYEKQNNPYMAG